MLNTEIPSGICATSHNIPLKADTAPRQATCPRCQGRGTRGGSRPNGGYHHIECSRCSGTGMLDIPADVERAIQLGVQIKQLEAELKAAKQHRQTMEVIPAMGWGAMDANAVLHADGRITACEQSMWVPQDELTAIRANREYKSWRLFVDDQIMIALTEANRAKDEARKIAAYKSSVAMTRLAANTATPLQGERVIRVVPEGERLNDPFASNVSRELVDGKVIVTVSEVVR